jgi:hypothetical protein
MCVSGIGDVAEEEASAAAREARDCGAMDSTGMRCPGDPGLGFAARTERTSVWDWRVIRTDSAEVMQPLYGFSDEPE